MQLVEALHYKLEGHEFDSRWSLFEIFHWLNPSGQTMALGSTQLVTEMSTSDLPWGVKATGAWGWKPCHLYVPTMKILAPQPPGALGAYLGLYMDSFTLPHICMCVYISWKFSARIWLTVIAHSKLNTGTNFLNLNEWMLLLCLTYLSSSASPQFSADHIAY